MARTRTPKAPDPAAELGVRLIQHLEQTHAPTPLNALLSAAAPDAPPELIAAAMQKPPFKRRVIVSVKLVHTAPVALVEDAAALAESPDLIRAALEPLYDAGAPPWPAAKLVPKVATPLKKPFQAALERRMSEGTLPPEVGTTIKAKKPALYLNDRPPPPPPVKPPKPPKPPKPLPTLIERLVETLAQRRTVGPTEYPTTLQHLIEPIAPAPEGPLLDKAIKSKSFQTRVLIVAPKNAGSPVAFRDDRASLATSPALLNFLLGAARKPDTHAFPAKDLVKPVAKPLQAEILATLDAAEPDVLPPAVGFIVIKGKRHFFALADAHAGKTGGRNAPESAAPSSFAAAFDEVFARLDRQAGGINFVNLRDLRRDLPHFGRAEFDMNLLELRRDRRYTLKAAEGLDGLAADERDAGIWEDGDLLLNVSRLRP